MIRNMLILFVVISAMALAVVFAALNPGLVQLDLAFFEVELQKSLAFVLAFGVGALFGMVCALLMLLKLLNDRRSLRKALKLAEAEVISLREIPLNDAK
jgi:lipopolysaccharide assembly protein A